MSLHGRSKKQLGAHTPGLSSLAKTAMYNNRGRPLTTRQRLRIYVCLTILMWATKTLLHQWHLG